MKLGRRLFPLSERRGRPHGSQKISDDALFSQLQDLSAPTSRLHDRLGIPVRTLDCSKRRAAVKLVKTQPKALRKSQLCARIKHCKIGISSHSTARGKCDACMAWFQFGSRKVQNLISECKATISALVPCYFNDWERVVKSEALDTYSLAAPDNPEYIKGLVQYVAGAERRHPEQRAHLSADDLVCLAALEIQAVSNLEAEMEDVANMAWHLSLKRTVDSLWAAHWNTPRPRVLYGLWDHMVPKSETNK